MIELNSQSLTVGVAQLLIKKLTQIQSRPLSVESDEDMHQLVRSDHYLKALKKLCLNEPAISKSKQFLRECQQFEEELVQCQQKVTALYQSIPRSKCYFSTQIAHGFHTRATFPYVPKSLAEDPQPNWQKRLYQKLLNYNQSDDFRLEVSESTVHLKGTHFSQKLTFYEDVLYFDAFTPEGHIQDILNPYTAEVNSTVSKLSQIVSQYQHHEELLNYIFLQLQDLILQCQWWNIARSFPQFKFVKPNSFEQFLERERQRLELPRCYPNEVMVRSGNNSYLRIREASQVGSREVYWSIDDNLEEVLFRVLREEREKSAIRTRHHSYKVDVFFKFEVPEQAIQQTITDQVDQLFARLGCKSGLMLLDDLFITLEPLRLYKAQGLQEIMLTLRDSLKIDTILKSDVSQLRKRLIWILLRNLIVSMPQTIHKVEVVEDSIIIRVSFEIILSKRKLRDEIQIKFDPERMVYLEQQVAITQFIPSVQGFDPRHVTKLVEEYIFNARQQAALRVAQLQI